MQTLQGHTSAVVSLDIDRKDRLLVSGGLRETARIWDLTTATVRTVFPAGVFWSGNIVFAEDGRALYMGGTPVLWDIDGRSIGRYTDADDPGHTIVVSPDFKVIINGDYSDLLFTDAVSKKAIRRLDTHVGGFIKSITFSSCGTRVATCAVPALHVSEDDSIQIWNVYSGHLADSVQIPAHIIQFSPSAPILATARGGSVTLWDATDYTPLDFLVTQGYRVHCLKFSADGKLLMIGRADGIIQIWHVATARKVRDLVGLEGEVLCLATANDASLLIAGSDTGQIAVWERAEFLTDV